MLPENSSALLSDIVAVHPIEQGAAEIVGYLALNDEDVAVDMDETDETVLRLRRSGRSGHHQAGAAAEGDGATPMSARAKRIVPR